MSTKDYRKDPEKVAKLTPDQYEVTREAATETAFRNEYWDNQDVGPYVDIAGYGQFATLFTREEAT